MLSKKSPLSDSEFVLFVNHDQSQILKPYIILEDSMRRYDDINMSEFALLFEMIFVLFCSRTREQIYRDTHRKKKFC